MKKLLFIFATVAICSFVYTGCSDEVNDDKTTTDTTDNGKEAEDKDRKIFTSIDALESWLLQQPKNEDGELYKVGLKGVNLDAGNNWGDLGSALGDILLWDRRIDLDLSGCAGEVIPDGYSSQGNKLHGAFIDNNNIIRLKLPDGLKVIGEFAFYKSNLIFVEFPNGLQEIRYGAFRNAHFKSLDFPEGHWETQQK